MLNSDTEQSKNRVFFTRGYRGYPRVLYVRSSYESEGLTVPCLLEGHFISCQAPHGTILPSQIFSVRR